MSSRFRSRPRVYASTLGVVENNYKEALARLEKSRRPSSAERETNVTRASPFTRRFDFNGEELDEELQAARSRASKVIHEKSVIDTSAESLRSRSLVPVPVTSSILENEFDDQVQATLDRIRASKNLLSQLQSDDTLEHMRNETRSKLSEQTSKKLAEKMAALDFADDFSEKQSVRKTLKIKAVSDSSSKWKDETAESFAAKRASATRARLQDIDHELQEFEEKQAARARRSAQLKKFIAENTCEELIPATTTEQSGTKVTTGMVRFKAQKKVVSF